MYPIKCRQYKNQMELNALCDDRDRFHFDYQLSHGSFAPYGQLNSSPT